MNLRERQPEAVAVIVFIFGLVVSILFPPWAWYEAGVKTQHFAGFHFIYSSGPELDESEVVTSTRYTSGYGGDYLKYWRDIDIRVLRPHVDLGRLSLQVIALSLCLCGAIIAIQVKKSKER